MSTTSAASARSPAAVGDNHAFRFRAISLNEIGTCEKPNPSKPCASNSIERLRRRKTARPAAAIPLSAVTANILARASGPAAATANSLKTDF